MASGMWLTFIEILIISIAGVILFVVVLVFSMSTGALSFGFNCYFAFVEYNLVNSYLEPFTSFISAVGFNYLSPSSASAAQIQSACITESNINAYSTADIATQIYGKAASCFDLFAGNNQQTGNTLLSKGNFNDIFNCYYGKIYNYESGDISNFSNVINYIDKNYYNPNSPLQIVLITNGSGELANYTNTSAHVENGSYYDIVYFRYPGASVSLSFPAPGAVPNPTLVVSFACPINWASSCYYDSKFAQPNITSSERASVCSYANYSAAATTMPVSSLSNGLIGGFNSLLNTKILGCAPENYTVPFCGILLNTMVNAQNRVFVCITNPG